VKIQIYDHLTGNRRLRFPPPTDRRWHRRRMDPPLPTHLQGGAPWPNRHAPMEGIDVSNE
jgi:hypothetical protein